MSELMSMGFDVLKLNANNLAGQEHHVLRTTKDGVRVPSKTKSVIKDPSLWFSPTGHVEVMPWRKDRLDKAKALSKRKDAVLAVGVWVQIGDQLNWRDGDNKPKNHPVDLTKFAEKIKQWAINEFGEENIVSIELHLDETSPHFHICATPIKDGKLNVKNWVKGIGSLQKMRKSAHSFLSENVIKLAQIKHGTGGDEHEPTMATGRENSPIQPKKPSLLGKFGIKTDDDLIAENISLQNEISILKNELRKEQIKSRNNAKLSLSRKQQEDLIKNNENLFESVTKLSKSSAISDKRIIELENKIEEMTSGINGFKKVFEEIDPAVYQIALNAAIKKEDERIKKEQFELQLYRDCDEIAVGLLNGEMTQAKAVQLLQNGGDSLIEKIKEGYWHEIEIKNAVLEAQKRPQSDLIQPRQGNAHPTQENALNRVKTPNNSNENSL